jgi:hypothetical protein
MTAPGATPNANDPLAFILPGVIGATPFPAGSRYAALPLAVIEIGGQLVKYVTRRFLPGPERFATLAEHVVAEGERPDTIAAATIGDPEQYWRLCDANNALHPREIAVPGARIRVSLPEGVPGAPDD